MKFMNLDLFFLFMLFFFWVGVGGRFCRYISYIDEMNGFLSHEICFYHNISFHQNQTSQNQRNMSTQF